MERQALSKEEELVILEEGLRSQFWQVYGAWLSQATLTAAGSALSENVDKREWMAGKATALKKALSYPSERVRDIKRLIEQSKKLTSS